MKTVLVVQALSLILLWACTWFLYTSTGELEIAHILAGVSISISSLGTGFFIYDIIKQWKELSK
jgi:hypothetical protein